MKDKGLSQNRHVCVCGARAPFYILDKLCMYAILNVLGELIHLIHMRY